MTKRIRVCFPILYYPPEFSGHGIQVQRSLTQLEKRGIEVTFLAHRLPAHLRGREDEPRVERVLANPSEPLAAMRKVAQLRRYFARNRGRFDLVHTVLTGWELFLNLGYLRSLGLPIVYEMILLGGNEPVSMSETRGGALKLRCLRHVDAWIGLSQTFLPAIRRAGIPTDRFRVVHGGVDIDRFRPRTPQERSDLRRRLGIPEHARVAISAGSVIHRKGMDRVVNAWSALRPEAGRDLLLLVGPNGVEDRLKPADVAFSAELQKQFERPHLAGTARMTGRVDNLDEYLAAADLFVFLSRREGLGYVTIEAMACGLPCIVSPMDGIGPELVVEGKTGFVAEDPDDAEGVARLISRATGSGPARAALARSARERAVQRFSMEARAEALEALYRSLIRPLGNHYALSRA